MNSTFKLRAIQKDSVDPAYWFLQGQEHLLLNRVIHCLKALFQRKRTIGCQNLCLDALIVIE